MISREEIPQVFTDVIFWTGLTDVMRFLIDEGAEVNTANGLGLTPLLVAVLNGNFEAAKVKKTSKLLELSSGNA